MVSLQNEPLNPLLRPVAGNSSNDYHDNSEDSEDKAFSHKDRLMMNLLSSHLCLTLVLLSSDVVSTVMQSVTSDVHSEHSDTLGTDTLSFIMVGDQTIKPRYSLLK